MAEGWDPLSECESVPSFDAPPETLIVPDTPPEVIARWEIDRVVDCYHRSGHRRWFAGVDGSEVVHESELPPPACIFDGSETQPPSEGFDGSERQPPAEGFDGSEPSLPCDESGPQPASSSKVEYTENEKAMLLILLPGMKDLI